jgi:single-strand DNA-binding protein
MRREGEKEMASLNKAMIMGNLGTKPELRSTKSGTSVTTLRVATNEVSTDSEGQRQEKTEWHSVVVFGKTAENCEKYLDKGRTVFVEGRIQTREWEDKDGNKRYSTEIVAHSVQFIGGRDSEGGGGGGGGYGGGGGGYSGGGGGGGRSSSRDEGGSSRGKGGGRQEQSFDDDDIPF